MNSAPTRVGENAAPGALGLVLRVQADAFRYDPLGYLQAWYWRARGLRLRSRNRLAALAGRSPHAYELWIAQREPQSRAAFPRAADTALVQPLIDCRHSTAGLQETLASLRQGPGARPIILGQSDAAPDGVGAWADVAQSLDPAAEWICPIYPGDLLAEDALAFYAAAASRSPQKAIIYADDDIAGEGGVRTHPHFKPNWNPELFEHHDFVTGSAAIRIDRDQLAQLPADGSLEMLVRGNLAEHGAPLHLPLVLHHRRSRPMPVLPVDRPAMPSDPASVTAIVPTRNKTPLLRACIEGLRRTSYPLMDIIVVDNGSDEPEALDFLTSLEAEGITVIRSPGPFNYSALNNAAARMAGGELLCFLNNDVEMIEADWLSLLVGQALRPDVGAVGAKLLYPDRTIQHAGVFIGIGGGAGHGHRYLADGEFGYFRRADLPQRVSAVTGACLLVSRSKFLEVGGFDEGDFPVAFNDVDLCLKLNARGWQSFYEPRASLIHHESKTRGSDLAKGNRVRFKGELAALKRKWRTDEQRDPYHHPQLSPFTEQFLIAV